MENTKIDAFNLVGISTVTTNANGQAAKDIGDLLNRFMGEGIATKIPNKLSEEVYSVYTDYEGDYTNPYRVLMGCKVSSLDEIPEGLEGRTIGGGQFVKFVAKGDLARGAVYNEWVKIWDTELDRAYQADFEIYGAKAQDPSNAEVDIFIGVR
ncbi:GyrI-like domain-containing protein [Flammeovirgaceae bacterium SG7u.111]|nr:GyrI-like domain-containing protein [Flammeovirgaceae bacterium SG7u.132]WPO33849.1 GyrI-like domain-containing protein [Flammeovirgaceae bacterium SG7u.111]